MQSKERAKELYEELRYDSIRVGVIHSDLSQAQVIKYLFQINQPLSVAYISSQEYIHTSILLNEDLICCKNNLQEIGQLITVEHV